MIDLEVGARRERIRPGLHVCQFYNQPGEVIDTAASLLRDGLRIRDKCYVAAPPAQLEAVCSALLAAGVDADRAAAGGQLQLIGVGGELLKDGRFDPHHLLAAHRALLDGALREGWRMLRAVIDMGWLAAESGAAPEQLLTYEAAADAAFTFQNVPVVILAQYAYAALPGELVVELLKLHPVAVVGKFLKRNPYYVNAEEYMHRRWGRGRGRAPDRPVAGRTPQETATGAAAPLKPSLEDALETLRLAARGHSPQDVAALRGRSLAAVRADVELLYEHLGAATLPTAIAEARRRGLIE